MSAEISEDLDVRVNLNQKDLKFNLMWYPSTWNTKDRTFTYISDFRMGPQSNPKHVATVEISPASVGPVKLWATFDWKTYIGRPGEQRLRQATNV